ncbi:MAG: hypothetical protein ACXADA_16950 [Candidatus Hodarchaeales archaeon]
MNKEVDQEPGEKASSEKKTKKRKTTRKVKEKKVMCKKCSTVINPVTHPPSKTWQMVSPMPDKEGNVTLTIMGSFRCPNCGKSVIASLRKIKGDDIGTGRSKNEMLMEYLQGLTEKTPIEEIGKVVGINAEKIEKVLKAFIQRGRITGQLEDQFYLPGE